MERPLVLLSNDDGYRSEGIVAMAAALASEFDVITCAPDTEQSASSHALSLHRPLRLHQHAKSVFSVDGTPADSVYVALHEPRILSRKPDLVVSGMNHGLNLGQDVFYSGTVAAAREGALQGFPALAVSADANADMSAATTDAVQIARALLLRYPATAHLLNVNYPPGDIWKKRATVSGQRVYSGGLDVRNDPRGRPYYWIGGNTVQHKGAHGTDTEAFDAGIVGITQLLLELAVPETDSVAPELCKILS